MKRLKKEERNESGKNEWNNGRGQGLLAASFKTFLDIVQVRRRWDRASNRASKKRDCTTVSEEYIPLVVDSCSYKFLRTIYRSATVCIHSTWPSTPG